MHKNDPIPSTNLKFEIANVNSECALEEVPSRDRANPLNPSPGPYTGPYLTAWQYEALCRHALSRTYGIPIQAIETGYLQSPTKIAKKVRHQIDLYWTSHDGVCDFLVIANAKFRKENVTLTQLMTLLGVQHDLHAHKAMMITNTGYSATVLLQAAEKGIALLIVRPLPDIDFSSLPKSTAPAIAGELEKIASTTASPLYRLHIVHRGFDPSVPACPEPSRRASVRLGSTALTAGLVSPSPCPDSSPCPERSRMGSTCLPARPEPSRTVPAPPPAPSMPNKMIQSPPAPRASFGMRRK